MSRVIEFRRHSVVVRKKPDGSVELELSNLAARRLMLALGVQTRRYGPEVSSLLRGLARLLIGVDGGALEVGHPHGPGCTCEHCEEAFHGRRR